MEDAANMEEHGNAGADNQNAPNVQIDCVNCTTKKVTYNSRGRVESHNKTAHKKHTKNMQFLWEWVFHRKRQSSAPQL